MIKLTHLWRTTAVAALLATALCVAGLIYAVNDMLNPQMGSFAAKPSPSSSSPSSPSPAPESPPALTDKEQIRVVALGDSLTKGTGDTSGKGYAGMLRELLHDAADVAPTHMLGNYAVNGYRTDQLLRDLETQPAMTDMIAQADLVLLTIGGNDLFAIGRNLFDAEADQLDPERVKERMPEPLQRLEQVIDKLAQLNPQAVIVYVGLYNPFYDLDDTGQLSEHVQEWNYAAYRMTGKHQNVLFIPTFDLFQLHFDKYMYTDHFHPNQQGYERMAQRIFSALR